MPSSSSTCNREEKLYVLFGSQTGNSEQAAQDFCAQAGEHLSAQILREQYQADGNINVTTVCMQLDDFLELEQAPWTRLTIIFTSSYGVGQPPLGCWRFRELCDAWLENDNQQGNAILQGFSYALCGLGDSKYTTFFRNPTVIDTALTAVGATRIGPLGKCDASGTVEQPAVIRQWTADIWDHVAKTIVQAPLRDDQLLAAQEATVALCRQINPDFSPAAKSSKASSSMTNTAVMLLVVLVAIVVAFYVQSA